MEYKTNEDLSLIKTLLNISWETFADKINVSPITLNRWLNEKSEISNENLEKIYDFAFKMVLT